MVKRTGMILLICLAYAVFIPANSTQAEAPSLPRPANGKQSSIHQILK
jgi:hypothetical protein